MSFFKWWMFLSLASILHKDRSSCSFGVSQLSGSFILPGTRFSSLFPILLLQCLQFSFSFGPSFCTKDCSLHGRMTRGHARHAWPFHAVRTDPPWNGLTAVSGVACPQGGRPGAVSRPLRHATPVAYGSLYLYFSYRQEKTAIEFKFVRRF